MKHQSYFVKTLYLVFGFICLNGFSLKGGGGDYYKVLLNGRLVAEQYLTKPIALKALSLNASNHNDKLTVYYSHCGQPGSRRSIILKSESGKVLKEWKFSDSQSQEMQISVGEVLNASLRLNTVSVFYASTEIPAGRQIISLNTSTIALAKR